MKYILTVLAFIALSFSTSETKLLTVRYSVEDWQSKVNMLEYTKNVLKQSNSPANVVLPLTDSLTKFQNEIISQVRVQIDTTKKK